MAGPCLLLAKRLPRTENSGGSHLHSYPYNHHAVAPQSRKSSPAGNQALWTVAWALQMLGRNMPCLRPHTQVRRGYTPEDIPERTPEGTPEGTPERTRAETYIRAENLD